MTLFTGHCLFPLISTWNLVSSCLSSFLLPAKHIWSEGNNTYNIIAEIFTTNTTAYTKYLYVPPHSTATGHAHGDMWLVLSNELWVELMCAISEPTHGFGSLSFAAETWKTCGLDDKLYQAGLDPSSLLGRMVLHSEKYTFPYEATEIVVVVCYHRIRWSNLTYINIPLNKKNTQSQILYFSCERDL